MIEIADLLTVRGVIAQLRTATKRQTLQELSRRAALVTDLPDRRIYDVLNERERLGSTGIGRGVAIPHGRLAELTRPVGLFARLERPIPFESIDGQPVDLAFVLLTPSGAGADHLTALSRISRLLRDQATCAKLRGADNADALYALLTTRTESHAA